MKNTTAIILAGGLGTRIASLTKGRFPKPMLLIQKKPFLEYLLNWLAKQGLKQVVLAVGFQSEVIKNYFGQEFKKIKLIYSDEGNGQLGTGGAIKKVLSVTQSEYYFVINGDTFFPIDLEKLYKFHLVNNVDFSISLKEMENCNRFGTVEINEKTQVVKFNEKQNVKKGLINGGIYCFGKKTVKMLRKCSTVFSLEKDFLSEKKDLVIGGKKFNNCFFDIGIEQDFRKFQDFVLSKEIK